MDCPPTPDKTFTDNALWSDYELTADIRHRSGIESAKLYWTIDMAVGYQSIDMILVNSASNTWAASIPHQPDGTKIFYYIEATANSGKTQVRPLGCPRGLLPFHRK